MIPKHIEDKRTLGTRSSSYNLTLLAMLCASLAWGSFEHAFVSGNWWFGTHAFNVITDQACSDSVLRTWNCLKYIINFLTNVLALVCGLQICMCNYSSFAFWMEYLEYLYGPLAYHKYGFSFWHRASASLARVGGSLEARKLWSWMSWQVRVSCKNFCSSEENIDTTSFGNLNVKRNF